MFRVINIKLEKKFLKDALYLYVGRGLNIFTGILSTVIYGAIFSKKQIAIISLFDMVKNLFLSFGFTWSTLGLVRFGREEYLRSGFLNNTSSIRLTLIGPILILSGLLVYIFRGPVIDYVGTNDSCLVFYMIAGICVLVMHEHVTYVQTAVEKHAVNVLYFLSSSVGKVLILVGFYAGIFHVSAEAFVKTNIFFLTALLAFRIPFLEKNFLLPLKRITKNEFNRFTLFVLPQIAGFTGQYVISYIDLYFIRGCCSLGELGAYQYLYSIFLKMCSFGILINTLFLPRIISWKNSENNRIGEYLTSSIYVVLGLSLFATVSVSILYKPVFSLIFGDKFSTAYPAFNILLWCVPLYFITMLLIPVLNAYDRVVYIQIASLISALLNLIIDFVWIRKYGVAAAAVGTFSAYLLTFILLISAVRRMFKLKLFNAVVSST